MVQGSRTVAMASAAIPSCRPVKPSRSDVVAFTATRSSGRSMISAIFARMASRCGPTLGRSQIKVASIWATRPPRAATRSDGVAQEQVGRGAAPLRIARREMRADVAVGDGAEHGVGDRMQQHVGVGMADQPVIVRHLHAAEPDMVALAEGVDVETLARADIRQVVQHFGLGAQKILLCGELDIGGFAGKDEDAMAGPFGHGGVVGQFAAAVGRARRDGRRGSGRSRNACGVCTARSAARSGVADDALVLGRSA